MLKEKIGQMGKMAPIALLVLLLSVAAMADNGAMSKEEDKVSDAEVIENNNTKDEGLADMSDPLAVFTMAGFGVTNRGLNLKVAKSYDTGNPNKLGMNLIEIKGIAGDILGWEDDANDSIDSIRVRNLTVNPNTGLGAQIDLSYDLNNEAGSLSYSMLQALPKMWRFNLYPLAGAGLVFGNNVVQDDGTTASGYTIPGTFATVGMYSKFTVTDKIWLNYNPIWNTTLSGSDNFKDYGFENHSSTLLHEAIISYQINPRTNVRYFANWSQYTDIADGDHRIEVNYQF